MTKRGRRSRQRKKTQKEQSEILALLGKHVSECMTKPLVVRGKFGKTSNVTHQGRIYPQTIMEREVAYLGFRWRSQKCPDCGLRYKTSQAPGYMRVKFFGVIPSPPDAITLLGLTLKTAYSG